MALLIQGSTGQEVKNLQTALNYHLPNALPLLVVDGLFGPKTCARVVQFQTLYCLKVDGIVGPKTCNALYTFVDCSHHLLTVTRNTKKLLARANLRTVGDNPSLPPPFFLPPLPRLQFPFPPRLPPIPPVLQPPRLEIDTRLLFSARITEFELEVGQQATFKSDLKSGNVEHEVALLTDLKGTIWSKPFGKLELSAGSGMLVEKRFKPTLDTETSVYVFGKAEVKDILKLGPLDLAKIAAEAQISGKAGTKEPPDMSTTVSMGPEVELFNGKVTFGTVVYLEYGTNGKEHTLTSGVKAAGAYHF